MTQKIEQINESKSMSNVLKKSTAINQSYLSEETRKKLKKMIKEK